MAVGVAATADHGLQDSRRGVAHRMRWRANSVSGCGGTPPCGRWSVQTSCAATRPDQRYCDRTDNRASDTLRPAAGPQWPRQIRSRWRWQVSVLTCSAGMLIPASFFAELRHVATMLLHLLTAAADREPRMGGIFQTESSSRTAELRGPRWGISPPSKLRVAWICPRRSQRHPRSVHAR